MFCHCSVWNVLLFLLNKLKSGLSLACNVMCINAAASPSRFTREWLTPLDRLGKYTNSYWLKRIYSYTCLLTKFSVIRSICRTSIWKAILRHLSWTVCIKFLGTGRSEGTPEGEHKDTSDPPPPPRVMGCLCSFPNTWTPHLRTQTYPLFRLLVIIGLIKKHPLSLVFSGNLPKTNAPNTPFLEKMGTHMWPLMRSSGGGGGGADVWKTDTLSRWENIKVAPFFSSFVFSSHCLSRDIICSSSRAEFMSSSHLLAHLLKFSIFSSKRNHHIPPISYFKLSLCPCLHTACFLFNMCCSHRFLECKLQMIINNGILIIIIIIIINYYYYNNNNDNNKVDQDHGLFTGRSGAACKQRIV